MQTPPPLPPATEVLEGRISLVIPVWNGLGYTRSCFQSLSALREAGEPLGEVLFVDNGSSDGTREWLLEVRAGRPWVRSLHLHRNLGFTGGANAGLREARGEFLLVLNNDTLCEQSLLSKLLEAWQREPRVGLVAPVSNYVKGHQLQPIGKGEGEGDLPAIVERLETAYGDRLQEVDSLAGLCLLGHRSFYEELGLFDERYGIGNFEDDDLCLRARLAGYRLLIVRRAYVHHFGTRTFEALGLDYERQYHEQKAVHDRKWREEPLYSFEELYRGENWREIVRRAPGLDRSRPGFEWCLRVIARALEELDRSPEAIEPWQAFLDLHPLHVEGSSHHAFCLLQAGREGEGRRALVRTLESCPLDPVLAASLLTRFARHCWDRGLREEARAHLDSAFEILPDFLPAWNLKGVWLLEEEDYAEAEAVLLPHRSRESSDLSSNLGIAQFRQGKIEEALQAFQEGARLGGPESTAAANLRRLLSALGGESPCPA